MVVCGHWISMPSEVGMSNYTGTNQMSKLRFAFLMFDTDQSGFIELSELKNIIR